MHVFERLRQKIRNFRQDRLRSRIFGYLKKHFPLRHENYENLSFLKDLIIKINYGMHYGWPFTKTAMGNIKDDLIVFLLRNFRNHVEVGYLVGAGYKSCTIVVYGDGYKDIERQLRAKLGGRLISWYVRDIWDYWPKPSDDVEVCYMCWDDEDYLRYYECAKRGEYEELEDDYYGLIEISIDGTKIHFLAPRIEKIAEYIGKFDYIYSRWRVYGWRKPLEKTIEQKEIAIAIWYATKISEIAERVILDRWIISLLIEDKKLLSKADRYGVLTRV